MLRASLLSAAVLVSLAAAPRAAEDFSPDDDGYIRDWLVLVPIPLADGQSGAEGLAKEQVNGEAALKPKEGDKVTVGGSDYNWRKYRAKESHLDFNDFLEKQVENSVAYAVCYLNCPEEMTGLKLKMGSDDQAKVYLNGKEVLKCEQARPLTKDEDTAENVTLKKGVNVLVFKVVNEGIDWSGSIRFVNKEDQMVRNFKVQLTPQ
jgi:hypothetical protein